MSSLSRTTHVTAIESSTIPPSHLTGLAKLRWAVKNPPVDPDVSFAGKTVLVTGANVGLGYEAAVKYAQQGCSKLILAVRSQPKGEEAKKEILRRSRRGDVSFISILTVDLSTFDSVRAFISALGIELGQGALHIVLLNAGLANPTFVKSSHGYEMALQVNVLSTALMAILLLPIMRRTAVTSKEVPHLTFVNSFGHTEVQRKWYSSAPSDGDLLAFANNPDLFEYHKQYVVVKVLGMAVMQHVALSTLSSDGKPQVIVNACCPFFCRTNLGRNFSSPMKLLGGIMQFFTARTAEEGSRTLVSATVLGSESHGKFWTHEVLFPMGDVARDAGEMGRFWQEIEGAVERNGGVGDVKDIVRG